MNSHKRLSYAAIAAALAISKPQNLNGHNHDILLTEQWTRLVMALADVLANGNVRFNRKRFLTAAGVL